MNTDVEIAPPKKIMPKRLHELYRGMHVTGTLAYMTINDQVQESPIASLVYSAYTQHVCMCDSAYICRGGLGGCTPPPPPGPILEGVHVSRP